MSSANVRSGTDDNEVSTVSAPDLNRTLAPEDLDSGDNASNVARPVLSPLSSTAEPLVVQQSSPSATLLEAQLRKEISHLKEELKKNQEFRKAEIEAKTADLLSVISAQNQLLEEKNGLISNLKNLNMELKTQNSYLQSQLEDSKTKLEKKTTVLSSLQTHHQSMLLREREQKEQQQLTSANSWAAGSVIGGSQLGGSTPRTGGTPKLGTPRIGASNPNLKASSSVIIHPAADQGSPPLSPARSHNNRGGGSQLIPTSSVLGAMSNRSGSIAGTTERGLRGGQTNASNLDPSEVDELLHEGRDDDKPAPYKPNDLYIQALMERYGTVAPRAPREEDEENEQKLDDEPVGQLTQYSREASADPRRPSLRTGAEDKHHRRVSSGVGWTPAALSSSPQQQQGGGCAASVYGGIAPSVSGTRSITAGIGRSMSGAFSVQGTAKDIAQNSSGRRGQSPAASARDRLRDLKKLMISSDVAV